MKTKTKFKFILLWLALAVMFTIALFFATECRDEKAMKEFYQYENYALKHNRNKLI
jgi:hypothetical protein